MAERGRDRPCLVAGEPEGGVARVVAADALARAAGVKAGMPRRQAEGLCPSALVLHRDLGEEARRFERVVERVETVVPHVEVAEPGLLFVPVGGAVRYYGGEQPLVERIEKELEGLSWGGWGGVEHQPRLGLADGPFAARWAAALAMEGPLIVEDSSAFVSTLDVAALGREELVDTFRWLGLFTLGDLASLPREAVASRFGRVGLEAHRLASGEDRLPHPRPIPPELAVEGRYEDPLEQLDQVGFAARALAGELMGRLRQQGIAPHRVVIEAESTDGTVKERVWRSADPFTERGLADRVWWQLRAWVDKPREKDGSEHGIVRLRLDPADLSGEGRQPTLLEDVSARVEADRALARAQALLGPDAVLVGMPQGGRTPGERIHWRRWDEEATVPDRDPAAPWPGATPSPTPALVPPEPSVLEVEWEEGLPVRVRLSSRWEPVLTWAGPWRLVGRWWLGEEPTDRYQLVTSAGAFLVAVRGGRTFLAGVYD